MIEKGMSVRRFYTILFIAMFGMSFSVVGQEDELSLGTIKTVVIDAGHQCMSTRGIHKTESSTITSRMLGIFRDKPETRAEFMHLIHSPKKF